VCTTWGIYQKKTYLLDVLRRRMDFPALKHAVKVQSAVHRPHVILIEDKASGIQLVQVLRQEGISAVKPIKPLGDKVMRMNAQTPQIQGGFVLLPRQAPWLDVYRSELITFPKGKYDDQ